MITIYTIGKRHEDWVKDGIERYQGRLRVPFDIKWELIPHSNFDGDRARQEESDRLLQRLGTDDYVLLLDERGKNIDSPTLSSLLGQQFVSGKKIAIIIGGAYGVDRRLHDRAQFIWSLSRLVFPHQLVRLLLAEQIYRAEQIERGSGYHHQ